MWLIYHLCERDRETERERETDREIEREKEGETDEDEAAFSTYITETYFV